MEPSRPVRLFPSVIITFVGFLAYKTFSVVEVHWFNFHALGYMTFLAGCLAVFIQFSRDILYRMDYADDAAYWSNGCITLKKFQLSRDAAPDKWEIELCKYEFVLDGHNYIVRRALPNGLVYYCHDGKITTFALSYSGYKRLYFRHYRSAIAEEKRISAERARAKSVLDRQATAEAYEAIRKDAERHPIPLPTTQH